MIPFSILEIIALVCIAYVIFCIVRKVWCVLYNFYIGPVFNKTNFKSKGRWALVTGCTDGIGKQYARELAARGCDIVLISRSLHKLNATAEEIEKDYKVATKVIQADFGDDVTIYDHISKEIADLEIGTLVNNVAVYYDYPEYFLDVPDWDKTMSTMLKANIASVIYMTRLVLPGMVKRRKGVVVNVGSTSSVIPSPLAVVYAATKAFVEKFSEGLGMEYSKKGITVQYLFPGYVATNMSGIRQSSLFAPSAKKYARSAIGMVGTTSYTTGYLPHAVMAAVINFIYASSNKLGVWLVTRSMESTRNKALKKYKT